MINERKTENLIRSLLRENQYISKSICIEEQKSDNPKIAKLLKYASKKGLGTGSPEFIISFKKYPELLVVIECKASPLKHRSKTLDKFSEFACDGALLYASYLSKEYDVIAIGVSGEKKSTLKIDAFIHLKNEPSAVDFDIKDILPPEDLYRQYIQTPEKFNVDYSKLLTYSQELNGRLHRLRIKESQRSLLISSILIALKNKAFSGGYLKHKTAKQLAENLVQAVIYELDDSDIPKDKIDNLKHAYAFIKTNTMLSSDKSKLEDLISEIDKEINGFIESHKYFDTIGQFYIEFLRYANNDKGLGIVLTPPHITELFAEISEANKASCILDNCCGTGGFLISAMKKMVADCDGDSRKIAQIKKSKIIGIEFQDDIYALAISNMILQDDGKSSIALSSCFDSNTMAAVKKKKPNIGFLNPPYKTEKADIEELEYVLNNLDMLEKNSKCFALIPISCVIAQEGEGLRLKQKIMDLHTVEAVMSLPEDIFHNSKVGVITCILVLTAHVPHNKNKKTWLGYWRNDGFRKIKGKGRVDRDGLWNSIRERWVEAYIGKEVIPGFSVSERVAPSDEWCAEAYLQTDYQVIKEDDLLREIKNYLAFEIMSTQEGEHEAS